MTILERFKTFVGQNHLLSKNDLLLLTVSGGRDSVTLCELCFQSGYLFEIAHCNFQLRGEESIRDEAFAANLSSHYSVPFHVRRFDTHEYATEQKISTQVAARNLRYQWFSELVNSLKKDNKQVWTVTAHHANDNIETLLMNFLRGTGIDGLQGIPVRNENIVRPLLFLKREEIDQFIAENHLSYVEDSSNLTDKYTRNYIRHQLLPSIKNIFPAIEDNLTENLIRFHDIKSLYEEGLSLNLKSLIEKKGNEYFIPVFKLLKKDSYRTILYEVLKPFNFLPSQIKEVAKLLHAESGKSVSSSSHKIIRDRKWLIITILEKKETNYILIEEGEAKIKLNNGILSLSEKEWNSGMKIPPYSNIAILDKNEITFPLLLRPWKTGDYFYPLGMQKKKKVSRFFIDQKISVLEKEKTRILEFNKKIVWVVGHRIDNRFKVTEKTKSVLVISFNKSETTDPSSCVEPDK